MTHRPVTHRHQRLPRADGHDPRGIHRRRQRAVRRRGRRPRARERPVREVLRGGGKDDAHRVTGCRFEPRVCRQTRKTFSGRPRIRLGGGVVIVDDIVLGGQDVVVGVFFGVFLGLVTVSLGLVTVSLCRLYLFRHSGQDARHPPHAGFQRPLQRELRARQQPPRRERPRHPRRGHDGGMVAVRSSERVELGVCQSPTHHVRHDAPGVVVGKLAPVGEHDLLDVHPRRVGEAVDVHADPGEDPGLPGRRDVVLLPELLDLVRHVVAMPPVVVPGARVPAAGFAPRVDPARTPRGLTNVLGAARQRLRDGARGFGRRYVPDGVGGGWRSGPPSLGTRAIVDRRTEMARVGAGWGEFPAGRSTRSHAPSGASCPSRAAIATRRSPLLVGSRRAAETGPKTCRAGVPKNS